MSTPLLGTLTAGEVERLGATMIGCTLEEIIDQLPKMDAVSVHVPATDDTKGSCGSEFFNAMKPGAYFTQHKPRARR